MKNFQTNGSQKRRKYSRFYDDEIKCQLIRYIDKAREIGNVKEITVQGPFIFFNLLKDVISYASDQGFNTRIPNNCSWAEIKKLFEAKIPCRLWTFNNCWRR